MSNWARIGWFVQAYVLATLARIAWHQGATPAAEAIALAAIMSVLVAMAPWKERPRR